MRNETAGYSPILKTLLQYLCLPKYNIKESFLFCLTSLKSWTREDNLHPFDIELDIFGQVEAEDDPVHLVPPALQEPPHRPQRHLASLTSRELAGTSANARECLHSSKIVYLDKVILLLTAGCS